MASNDKKESMVPVSGLKTREKAVFVAQQLHFANTLAGNDPKHRARAMKKLRKYFCARANGNFSFTHDDFMRIWKGLFYCMWMSDKPLIQEELAEEISQLIHCFQHVDMALTFVQAFFDTLLVEWFGIDYHRIDKFQMFVRRFLRQSLVFCKNRGWKKVPVNGLCDVFESTLLSPSKSSECRDISLIMHFSDIYVEELAKVGNGKLSEEIMLIFLRPFITNLAEQSDSRLLDMIRDRVFYCLIRQSPEGLEYEEKFQAWKRAGFPGRSWKEMVFVGEENNRSGVKINNMDPRAGKVNVYLPHLQFDAESVADALRESSKKTPNKRSRRYIQKIAFKFQELAKGRYPLALKISKSLLDSNKYKFSKQKIDEAVENLLNFEEEIKKKDREMKKNGKRKKNSSKLIKSKKMKLENTCADEDNTSEGNGHMENEEMKLCDSEYQVEGTHHCKSPLVVNDETSNPALIQNDADIHENFSATDLTEQIIYKQDEDDTYGNETDSSYTNITKKDKKMHNVSSWNVSEISDLQEKDVDLVKAGQETDVAENILQEEILHNLEDLNPENSPENGEVNGSQEGGEKESKVECEEETEDQTKSVVTPLRRSTRRRSNVVPTPNEVHQNEDESRSERKLPNGREQTSLTRRKSLTPRSIIRAKRRISTAPDREIPYVHETGELSDSINELVTDSSAPSSENETFNGVLRNKQGSSPSQKVFQTPGKKRVSLKSTPSSMKKVNIVLQKNKSQAVSDYDAALKQSPSIPYDANKMPCKGVLKRTSMRSPMNPFYVPSEKLE